jgi:hypothetical protein
MSKMATKAPKRSSLVIPTSEPRRSLTLPPTIRRPGLYWNPRRILTRSLSGGWAGEREDRHGRPGSQRRNGRRLPSAPRKRVGPSALSSSSGGLPTTRDLWYNHLCPRNLWFSSPSKL